MATNGSTLTSQDYMDMLQEALQAAMNITQNNPYRDQLLALVETKDDAYYRTQAEAAVMPGFNQQVEKVTQAQVEADLAYEQSKEALQRQADMNKNNITQSYASSQGDLQLAANRRGLGRSSYLLDSMAYLEQQKNTGLAGIDSQLIQGVSDITGAQALAKQHHSQTLDRLYSDLASTVLDYQLALKDKDMSQTRAAYQALMDSYDSLERYKSQQIQDILQSLYGYAYQREQDLKAEQEAAAVASAQGGSSAGGGSNGNTVLSYDNFVKSLEKPADKVQTLAEQIDKLPKQYL